MKCIDVCFWIFHRPVGSNTWNVIHVNTNSICENNVLLFLDMRSSAIPQKRSKIYICQHLTLRTKCVYYSQIIYSSAVQDHMNFTIEYVHAVIMLKGRLHSARHVWKEKSTINLHVYRNWRSNYLQTI